jgi:hypothetical protein
MVKLWLFLAVALLLTACSDQVPPPATPTPTPTNISTATQTASPAPDSIPEVLKETDVTSLTQGDPIDPWPSYAFIMETGCWQCDGGSTGFIRVYGRADGTAVIDELLHYERTGYTRTETKDGQTVETDPYITGFAFEPDASDMWISLCVRNACGGGLASWSADSESLILRSRDGGVTWTEAGRLGGGGFVITTAGPDQIIVGFLQTDGWPPAFAYFPGLEPLTPPVEGDWPVGYLKGGPLWRKPAGNALEYGGRLVADFGDNAGIAGVSVAKAPSDGGDFIVGWNWPRSTGEQAYFASLVYAEGFITQSYEYPRFFLPGVYLPKGLIAGNAEVDQALLPGSVPEGHFTYLPAVIDLDQRVVRPLFSVLSHPDFPKGRNQIVAAQPGDFARVVNTGSCLNVRSEPGESAPVLECVHDGVLLRDIEKASRLVSYTPVAGWVEVQTASGSHGWASTEYLER